MDSENESQCAFKTMDKFGYNKPMVEFRRKMQLEKDNSINGVVDGYSQITAGSKGEGYSSYYENDQDMLYIDKYRVCVFLNQTNNYPKSITLFTMHDEKCSPGYFRIRLLQTGTQKNCIDKYEVLCENNDGDVFVSREAYSKAMSGLFLGDKGRGVSTGASQGPSIPAERALYKEDRVWAFRCAGQKKLLREWIERKRLYGWPPQQLIEEISNIEAQLVPVGCKDSKHRDLEWRVCFVPSEIKLSTSFNETQYKLYIFLKMIKSSALNPVCKSLSSYILKNVVFWLVEMNPSYKFVPENFLLLAVKALQLFYGYVENKHMPYYMIPDRNLLAGCITHEDRSKLLKKLESLISFGPTMELAMQCKLFQDTNISITNDKLNDMSSKRDKLEILRLRHINIRAKYFRPGYSVQELESVSWKDKEFRTVCYETNDVVWPEWKHFLAHDLTQDNPFTETEWKWFQEMAVKGCGHRHAELIYNKHPEFAKEINLPPKDIEHVTVERMGNAINLALVKIEIALSSW